MKVVCYESWSGETCSDEFFGQQTNAYSSKNNIGFEDGHIPTTYIIINEGVLILWMTNEDMRIYFLIMVDK